jgi:signal transduction histidine kinase
LYLVKHLVELHEGQIWAESEGPWQGLNLLCSHPNLSQACKGRRLLL